MLLALMMVQDAEPRTVRIYDVRDLCYSIECPHEIYDRPLMVQDPPSLAALIVPPVDGDVHLDFDELVELVRSYADPGAPRMCGSGIIPFDDVALIVIDTERVHADVSRALRTLRR